MNNVVRPLPVVKDKYGHLIKDYDQRDWLIAIQEEYKEVIEQIILTIEQEPLKSCRI